MQILAPAIPLTLLASPEPDAAPGTDLRPAWTAIPGWHAALPEAARGRWCLLRVRGMAPGSALRLRLADDARGHTVRELFLRRPRLRPGTLQALLHVPAESRALHLDGFGPGRPGDARLAVLSRPEAAARLLAAGLVLVPAALRGSPLGLSGRLRATLGRPTPARLTPNRRTPDRRTPDRPGPRRAAGRPDYADWCARYDRRNEADRAALLTAGRHAPPIHAVVAGEDGPARAATLRSLHAQWRPADSIAPRDAPAPQDGDPAAAGARTGYLAVLGAGEILPPHALALVAAQLAAWTDAGAPPDIVHADGDRLHPDGRRDAPLFLGASGEALLLSGLLTRGLLLARIPSPDSIPAPPHPDAPRPDTARPDAPRSAAPRPEAGPDPAWRHADAARLRLWLRAGPQARVRHLPVVLTHRPADAHPAADTALAAIARAHLGARGTVAAARPLRIRRHPAGQAAISVIVPSACRGRHVPRCLARLLADTAHPIHEILVAVSCIDAADRRQAGILRQLAELAKVRVLDLGQPGFNYARANNLAAAQATGDTLLLLNDDVAPLRPPATLSVARVTALAGSLTGALTALPTLTGTLAAARFPAGPGRRPNPAPGPATDPGQDVRPDPRLWLSTLAAHLEDDGVGAVGARLLYGDGRVQHGGVVLGLGGLAEHADRLRAGHDPGPHGLARIDREMSAATAACLLLRRATWEALGGMDERFAIALNDVDLCLRLRGLGLGVRQANTAELMHYESLSLGRHYAGDRADLEAREVHLLRTLHGPALDADPFHSPNLSLEQGAEDQPAFPPRR